MSTIITRTNTKTANNAAAAAAAAATIVSGTTAIVLYVWQHPVLEAEDVVVGTTDNALRKDHCKNDSTSVRSSSSSSFSGIFPNQSRGGFMKNYQDFYLALTNPKHYNMISTTCLCEAFSKQQQQQPPEENEEDDLLLLQDVRSPSWIRKSLSWLGISSSLALPVPRVLIPNDPDLTLVRRYRRQREKDEIKVQRLQQQIVKHLQNSENEKVGPLLEQSYNILYGNGITPAARQDFLQQYGCTGWTEHIIVTLLAMGGGTNRRRGFVELGAGNGQWARVLTDRYQQMMMEEEENKTTTKKQKRTKKFEFVLAYDDMSKLPLNPNIYTPKTKPYHQYFFDKVQKCDSVESVLKENWACRGRILLLVYPPDTSMAYHAIRTYAEVSPQNDTVVYVGEGRGGVNGNNDFFDYLEGTHSENHEGPWILWNVLPVKISGDKGYEKLFIFKRRPKNETEQ